MMPTHNPTEENRHKLTASAPARWAMLAGCVGLVAGVSTFSALLYLAPEGHVSAWGWNAQGGLHFADALGLHPTALDGDRYVALLTGAQSIAWLGFAALLLGVYRGPAPSMRASMAIAVPWLLGLAMLAPPTLSQDVYAYVGYARMAIVHGLNPYANSQWVLQALNDPIGPFLHWDMASPYGPLWTLGSIALVAPLVKAPLYWQVVVFKLVAALALLLIARSGAAIAGLKDPRHRTLTFVAIAFNPLFVIEGPVSGHNDLIMMAMLAAAAHALAIHRQRLGFLLVGLSVAVKLVTVLAIPWLLIRAWQDRRNRPARSRAIAVVGFGTIAFGSLLACYLPFLQTDSLLGGLADHLTWQGHKSLADALIEKAPFLLCFAAATWWLIRQRRPAAWHDAWVGASLCLILFGAGIWFPWYLTWPLALSLTRWDRPGWIASAVLLSLSAFLMLLYGFFPPGAR